MRCPKCHYLSFDPEPRCRNCGYDLEVDDTDLALRTAETAEPAEAPMPDLKLRERPAAPAAPVTLEIRPAEVPAPAPASENRLSLALAEEDEDEVDEPRELDELRELDEPYEIDEPHVLDESVEDYQIETEPEAPPAPQAEAAVHRPFAAVPAPAPAEPRRVPFRAPNTTAELPLFVKGMSDRADEDDDLALRTAREAAAHPRPPLAVRRPAPDPVRARPRLPERRLGPLDRDLLEDLKRVEREEAANARADARAFAESVQALDGRVEPIHRAMAAAVDAAMLGGIAAFVLWATLRLCDVPISGLGLNALVGLTVFLAMMDLSYLLMFTVAGGQTVGKMLMGIRVIDDKSGDANVSLGQAAGRALLTMISVIGLGLGWLPALFGRGLALHDRIAHTRVVRA